MEETFPKDFFERYSEGNCTEEEKAMLESWFLNELKRNAYRPSVQTLSAAEKEIWDKIQAGKPVLKTKPKRNISLWGWTSIAAVLAIGMLFLYNFRYNGKVETKAGTVFPTPNSSIAATKSENSFRKLPDGTLVILGQGSTLTISESFDQGSSREVILVGKAFFDVRHDAVRPFIIHTGDIKTTVLGTSFDIVAKDKSDLVTINVIRGKVRVENKVKALAVLTPNMQIVYNKTLETAEVNRVDASKELSWNRQEDMSFDDVSLKEAKMLLEERFKIKIVVTDSDLLNAKFSTSLGAAEGLDSFLKSLCVFINAKYNFKNNKEVSIEPLKPN